MSLVVDQPRRAAVDGQGQMDTPALTCLLEKVSTACSHCHRLLQVHQWWQLDTAGVRGLTQPTQALKLERRFASNPACDTACTGDTGMALGWRKLG